MAPGPSSAKRARGDDSGNFCRSSNQPNEISAILQSNGRRGQDYLTFVSNAVSTKRGMKFDLENPTGATLTIGDVNDTIYREEDDEVDGWGKFYLPEAVSMRVVGVVEGTSCLCDQLVLMTCEDRKVYAYDGEELHEVASSLQQLCDEGIEYPASKSYYDGEAFKHMTKADWAKVRQGAVGKKLDEEHHKLVTADKPRLLAHLKSMRQHTGVIC